MMKNNVIPKTANGNIILDYHIKIQDGWVAWVKCFHEINNNGTQMSKTLKKKDINDLHTVLGHPLEEITQDKGKSIILHLTSMFKHCKVCALSKAKMTRVSKTAVPHSAIKSKRLFIDISSPSTSSMGFSTLKTVLIIHGGKIWVKRCDDVTIEKLKGNILC